MIKRTKEPWLRVQVEKDLAMLIPEGEWTAKNATDIENTCLNLLKQSLPKTLLVDLSKIKEFDTAGVWLLQRTLETLKSSGYSPKVENAPKAFSILSQYLTVYSPPSQEKNLSSSGFLSRLENLGKITIDILTSARDLLIFLGQIAVGLFLVVLHPRRLRLTALIAQIEKAGVNAIPIVTVMATALGLVLAYQGEEQLRRFGAEIYTINLVSISVVREVGILITAILVAGRTGSAMTAEIGIMKMNQEIDALNTIGLNPMYILIIPRVLALILIMPCLAFISDLGGLLGGGIMVVESLNVSPQLYIYRIAEAVTVGGFWIGIIKAPFFGAIIGVVSCFEGMRVKNTAESIGRCTTRSVVEGIFLVTLADALLSVFFSKIGM